jgi:K+-sensing histidine kinase KdpD
MKVFSKLHSRWSARPTSYGFAVALISTGAATIIRHWLAPTLADNDVWMFFLLALGCTAWVGGALPTLFAAILAAIIANTLFLKSGSHVDPITVMRTVWFIVAAALIAFAGKGFVRQRAALRRNNELLRVINELAADFAYEMTSAQTTFALRI